MASSSGIPAAINLRSSVIANLQKKRRGKETLSLWRAGPAGCSFLLLMYAIVPHSQKLCGAFACNYVKLCAKLSQGGIAPP
jgi:hypothetical protein